MTTPLSDERIVEIRAREQAATPGPWAARHRACDRTPDDDDDGFLGLEVDGPPEASARGQFARGADAIFIAHARTDVPDLLAEVERLRDMLDRVAASDQAARASDRKRGELLVGALVRVARLKSVLRKVEWSGPVIEDDDGIGSPSCPWCGWVRRMVHHSRICELDAALREED